MVACKCDGACYHTEYAGRRRMTLSGERRGRNATESNARRLRLPRAADPARLGSPREVNMLSKAQVRLAASLLMALFSMGLGCGSADRGDSQGETAGDEGVGEAQSAL